MPNATGSPLIARLANALPTTMTKTIPNNVNLIDLVLRFCNWFGFVGSCNVFLVLSLEIQQSVYAEDNDTEAGMFCVSGRVNLSELKAFPMRSKLRV